MITHASTSFNYLASVAGARVNKNGDAARKGERRALEEKAFSSRLFFSLARHVSYAPATQPLTNHYVGLPTCDLFLAKITFRLFILTIFSPIQLIRYLHSFKNSAHVTV